MVTDRYIFDCEVYPYDWVFVFKHKITKEYTVIHNDYEAMVQFLKDHPVLFGGFNNKHYDQFIKKAVLCGLSPEQIKEINDYIVVEGHEGWEIPTLRQCTFFFDQYDLMDDCQMGLSLKAIEAHLGMNICETTVDFNTNRPLTDQELDEVIDYCKHDVDATDILDDLRAAYLFNKLALGREKDIPPARALYMTNAKLTAAYLDAKRPEKEWTDERNYQYPKTLLRQYIPQEVFDFFDRMHDMSIPSEVLFKEGLDIEVGGCPCRIAYGGIHGAIPCYREEATETRSIRNKDVVSYYPHQMTLNGFCSRNIPSPEVYEATIERRVKAKKAGDKTTANALKLVLNTTYGAMLNQYNDLYDPLMGRSVCISGQLQLLELAEHLIQDCPTLKIIQLNTDGIMVSLDDCDVPKYQEITSEWETRTGFELEEDLIKMICQKDVNNYVEVPFKGEPKIKGGVLVRGVVTNGNIDFAAMGLPVWENLNGGAFNINNNMVVVAKAVKDYLAYGIPVEKTITECDRLLDFQLIAKAGSKYGDALHEVDGKLEVVQKVNRVYATEDYRYGTLYKMHLTTGNPVKIAGLPAKCVVDNDNHLTIDVIDRDWYIRLAKRYVRDFLGIKPPKRNTRRVNSMLKRAALRVPIHNRELVQEAQGRLLSKGSHTQPPSVGAKTSNGEFSQSSLAQGAKKNIVQYLGIAADEPERIARHQKPGFMLPLVEIGWDEAYCRQICEENDLLSPIYTSSARGGCWFCHNQGVDQLRLLRKEYPDLWALLLKWDLDSPTTFKPDGHTVHDYDLRFQMEDEGKVPADRRFRWKMIIKEETQMAKKTENPEVTTAETTVDFTTLNVYQKLQMARAKFLSSGVKKTGKNIHLEFTYFELVDIVPVAERIFSEVGLLGVPRFEPEIAYMDIIDIDHPEQFAPITFYAPFSQIEPIVSNSGKEVTNKMQALGSSITYMRRYLWQLALDIIEADDIDPNIGAGSDAPTPAPAAAPKTTKKPATPAQRTQVKENLTSTSAPADELQIKGLKNALKQLMELDAEQESFVQEIAVKTDGFTNITKEQCEALVNGVAEMIAGYSAQEE